MADNTNSVIPNVSKDGKIEKWTMHTKDALNQERIESNREQRERKDANDANEKDDDDNYECKDYTLNQSQPQTLSV